MHTMFVNQYVCFCQIPYKLKGKQGPELTKVWVVKKKNILINLFK